MEPTIVLEAGRDPALLALKLKAHFENATTRALPLFVNARPGQAQQVRSWTTGNFPSVEIVETARCGQWLPEIAAPLLAFLPAQALYAPLPLDAIRPGRKGLWPWIPPALFPKTASARLEVPAFGWVASIELLQGPIASEPAPSLWDWERLTQTDHFSVSAGAAPAAAPTTPGSGLSKKASILALVPYYRCEEWLAQCLESLTRQTRPLDGILVLDDASSEPPLDIVKHFPNVTLWRSNGNIGPYRLIQSAIERTQYDGYLFQDADDYSALDRLELLLERMEETGAGMASTQEILVEETRTVPVVYPPDANQALLSSPYYSLVHPASLVSRELVMRSGGYAKGLRTSGDLEFSLRAAWMGRLVNLETYSYYRRIRKGSLISSSDTGMGSPAREALEARIRTKAMERVEKVKQGLVPDLTPVETAESARFEHLLGPGLKNTL